MVDIGLNNLDFTRMSGISSLLMADKDHAVRFPFVVCSDGLSRCYLHTECFSFASGVFVCFNILMF